MKCLFSTPFFGFVGKWTNRHSLLHSREGKPATLCVNGQPVHGVNLHLGNTGAACLGVSQPDNKFTNDQLECMNLKSGINRAKLEVDALGISAAFSIYLLDNDSKLIVTDIGGTITTSDFVGFVGGTMGFDVHHKGVIKFLDAVTKNGYNIVYLTSRTVVFDKETKKYLFRRRSPYNFPEGPVFFNPNTMIKALKMHFNSADSATRKTDTLKLLTDLFSHGSQVVVSAYGNKDSDTQAYANIGVPKNKIFVIDNQSVIKSVGTGELTSYKEQTEKLDQIYPPLSSDKLK